MVRGAQRIAEARVLEALNAAELRRVQPVRKAAEEHRVARRVDNRVGIHREPRVFQRTQRIDHRLAHAVVVERGNDAERVLGDELATRGAGTLGRVVAALHDGSIGQHVAHVLLCQFGPHFREAHRQAQAQRVGKRSPLGHVVLVDEIGVAEPEPVARDARVEIRCGRRQGREHVRVDLLLRIVPGRAVALQPTEGLGIRHVAPHVRDAVEEPHLPDARHGRLVDLLRVVLRLADDLLHVDAGVAHVLADELDASLSGVGAVPKRSGPVIVRPPRLVASRGKGRYEVGEVLHVQISEEVLAALVHVVP